MKTGIMDIQERRIAEAKKNRAGQLCFCGRFKWAGYDFCRRCQTLLPAEMRRPLVGCEIDIHYCNLADRCRDYLRAADRGDGEAVSKVVCVQAKYCKNAESCKHGIPHQVGPECRHAISCYDYRDVIGDTSATSWCEPEQR